MGTARRSSPLREWIGVGKALTRHAEERSPRRAMRIAATTGKQPARVILRNSLGKFFRIILSTLAHFLNLSGARARIRDARAALSAHVFTARFHHASLRFELRLTVSIRRIRSRTRARRTRPRDIEWQHSDTFCNEARLARE
jgi:hypothetical protein